MNTALQPADAEPRRCCQAFARDDRSRCRRRVLSENRVQRLGAIICPADFLRFLDCADASWGPKDVPGASLTHRILTRPPVSDAVCKCRRRPCLVLTRERKAYGKIADETFDDASRCRGGEVRYVRTPLITSGCLSASEVTTHLYQYQ